MPTKPTRSILGCSCARAASGHAAAAPPSATSNSRRPMVTVIHPSRARCVGNDTTPPACCPLTVRHPARAEHLDFKRFIFGRAVGRALINAGIGRMSVLGAKLTEWGYSGYWHSANGLAFHGGKTGCLKVPERREQKQERGDGRGEALNAHRLNKAELKVHKV